jgi:preprotein translocase subunit YajC
MTFFSDLILSTAHAQAAAGAPSQPSPFMSLAPLGMMLVVVYFMIIRPQQKKLKEHQAELDKLKNGDEVVTQAGIFGTITTISDKVVTLEVDKNVRIRVLKGQIATVVKGDKA